MSTPITDKAQEPHAQWKETPVCGSVCRELELQNQNLIKRIAELEEELENLRDPAEVGQRVIDLCGVENTENLTK